MNRKIHYVDVALRLQVRPAMKREIIAAGRRIARDIVTLPTGADDDSTRPMTDAELEEEYRDIESCIPEILEANPLLSDLKLDVIASVVHREEKADDFRTLPPIGILRRRRPSNH